MDCLYDEPQPGGSLLIAWQTTSKRVLVVGGGPAAASRVFYALEASANVVLVASAEDLCDRVKHYIKTQAPQLEHIDRDFSVADLEGKDLVFAAVEDTSVSENIANACKARRIPLNLVDRPHLSDFLITAQVRRGPLQIGVSTGGQAPKLSSRVKTSIESVLHDDIGEAITKVGQLRHRIREMDHAHTSSWRRMRWLAQICEFWPIDKLAAISPEQEEQLLELYATEASSEETKATNPSDAADTANNAHTNTNNPSTTTTDNPAPSRRRGGCPGRSSRRRRLKSTIRSSGDCVPGSVERHCGPTATHCAPPSNWLIIPPPGLEHLTQAPSQGDAADSGGPQGHKGFGELCRHKEHRRHKGPRGPRVQLVGAGPGDPDLLTVAAHRAMEEADLVLSDKLVPPEVLALLHQLNPSCEVHIARKFPGNAPAAQQELNDLGLTAVRAGKSVVRLKCGDPFVYGRGGEEVLWYRKHGFEAEVIPGLSSALTGPLTALIPVTHRGVARQVLLVTGQGREGNLPELPPWEFGGNERSLVILMGLGRCARLMKELLRLGWPADTPVAAIERASHPQQRVVRGTVLTAGVRVVAAQLKSPAILVVGGVVNALTDVPDAEAGASAATEAELLTADAMK